tara:strand:- start:524 stop:1594 length:1071 start_codon:yes stop_codon:yes gene_type:complete
MRWCKINIKISVYKMTFILLCGGLGYIGSHIVIECINNGYTPIIIDNFYNCTKNKLDILNTLLDVTLIFYECDLSNKENFNSVLSKIYTEHSIDTIIHLASYKAVSESNAKPLMYYKNNLTISLNILELMKKYTIKNLVFSSSATVYSQPLHVPILETHSVGSNLSSVYGKTKYYIEQIIQDFYAANINTDWNINCVILRYFNPIGNHFSGVIGDSPVGIPNNLLPYIQKVITGELSELKIFGNTYNTLDGTAERDYIHVLDLANAHIKSIEYLNNQTNTVLEIFNIGSGKQYSVLQILTHMEETFERKIPFSISDKREGDVDSVYADASKANIMLNWKPRYNLKDMCHSILKFIQ